MNTVTYTVTDSTAVVITKYTSLCMYTQAHGC